MSATPGDYIYYKDKDISFIIEHLQYKPDTAAHWGANAALQKRIFDLNEKVAIAQIEAAKATKDTALYTKKNTFYMLLSVIVFTIVSSIQILINFIIK